MTLLLLFFWNDAHRLTENSSLKKIKHVKFLFADKYSILKRQARDKRDTVGKFTSPLTHPLQYDCTRNDLIDICFETKQTLIAWQSAQIRSRIKSPILNR